jgi:hypothetical protein
MNSGAIIDLIEEYLAQADKANAIHREMSSDYASGVFAGEAMAFSTAARMLQELLDITVAAEMRAS